MSEIAEQYYQEGIKALQEGVFPLAEEMFSKAIKEEPTRFEFWNLLGLSHQFQKQWKQCDQAWRKALKYKPSCIDTKLNLGIANIAMGNKSDAESFWLSILDTNPNHIQALINLGLLYREQDRNKQAHNMWVTAFSLMPQNSKLREWIADVKGVLGIEWLRNGRADLAEDLLKDAIELDPEYAILWQYLAEWQLENGELAEAEEACAKGLTISPEDEDLKGLMAKVQKVTVSK